MLSYNRKACFLQPVASIADLCLLSVGKRFELVLKIPVFSVAGLYFLLVVKTFGLVLKNIKELLFIRNSLPCHHLIDIFFQNKRKTHDWTSSWVKG